MFHSYPNHYLQGNVKVGSPTLYSTPEVGRKAHFQRTITNKGRNKSNDLYSPHPMSHTILLTAETFLLSYRDS